jgi:hypothetical protein
MYSSPHYKRKSALYHYWFKGNFSRLSNQNKECKDLMFLGQCIRNARFGLECVHMLRTECSPSCFETTDLPNIFDIPSSSSWVSFLDSGMPQDLHHIWSHLVLPCTRDQMAYDPSTIDRYSSVLDRTKFEMLPSRQRGFFSSLRVCCHNHRLTDECAIYSKPGARPSQDLRNATRITR